MRNILSAIGWEAAYQYSCCVGGELILGRDDFWRLARDLRIAEEELGWQK